MPQGVPPSPMLCITAERLEPSISVQINALCAKHDARSALSPQVAADGNGATGHSQNANGDNLCGKQR